MKGEFVMGRATDKQIKFASTIAETLNIKLPDNATFESLRDFINQNMSNYNAVHVQDVRQRIVSEIQIVELARELGLTPVRKGRYFSLSEHDSVIIDPVKNCFWQNSIAGSGSSIGKGDSVLGFAVSFGGMTQRDAFTRLASKLNYSQSVNDSMALSKSREITKELVLPKSAPNMRRVYAYLIKSRYIDQDIVQKFVSKKMLYQDIHNNCVFVSRDQNESPVFACVRGTNTEVRFVGDVAGCNYKKGFYINNNSDKLIVTESVIDAMSIMTILKAQGIDYDQYNYLPMAGATKFNSLLNAIEMQNISVALLALDNDRGGIENIIAAKEEIREAGYEIEITEHIPPTKKDWNDELKAAVNHQNIVEINFLDDKNISETYMDGLIQDLGTEGLDLVEWSAENQRYQKVKDVKDKEIINAHRNYCQNIDNERRSPRKNRDKELEQSDQLEM